MKAVFQLIWVFPLLTACGGAIPFPYSQKAPIPVFSGRIGSGNLGGAPVEISGHPETRSFVKKDGSFRTAEGSDFYFGMDQAYFAHRYRLLVSPPGKPVRVWSIERPGLLGYYPGQDRHAAGVDLGMLSTPATAGSGAR